MVLDFGFLKEEMLDVIDAPCDHGLIIWWDDKLLPVLFPGIANARAMYNTSLHAEGIGPTGKVYVVPFVPTAENLARHWFERLFPRVLKRTEDRATLQRLRVYETPNCWADYMPQA